MFKKNANKETVKDFEGGGNNDYLSQTGIYQDVTLKAVIFDEAANGGAVINFFVEHNGVDQIVYGDLRVYNKGGKDNKIGQEKINELLIILDVDDLGEPEEMDLPIGKKKAMKTVAVFPGIEDEEITVRLRNEYSTWNGNIQEKSAIQKFYRNSDKATAAEILSEDEDIQLGGKFEKDFEYDAETPDGNKYDEITPAQVSAWIKAKRPKGTASAGATSSASKPSFNKPKKKFGGAK